MIFNAERQNLFLDKVFCLGVLKTEFKEIGRKFYAIFYRKMINGELNGELNESLKQTLFFIKANPLIQAKTISAKLNKPFSTVDKQVRTLLKKKLIKREGSKKTGGYVVIE